MAEVAAKNGARQVVANDTGGMRGNSRTLDMIARSLNVVPEKLEEGLRNIKNSMLGIKRQFTVTENGVTRSYVVQRRGCGDIRMPHGFVLFDFAVNDEWERYEVIVNSRIDDLTHIPLFNGTGPLFVRIDSGCATGQVFHDESCECREQLHLALDLMAENGDGLIVRIPAQDGRGMGLDFKLATLTLQYSYGLDTVQAARLLSEDGVIDRRTYSGVICILKFFQVPMSRGIALATNNPCKAKIFAENGYAIRRNICVKIPETPETKRHLDAKKRYLGHKL